MSIVGTYVRVRRSLSWVDILIFLSVAVLLYGLLDVAREWKGVLRPTVDINLSPLALPEYTFYSLVRGFAAYGISLLFTLIYGYIAAYNKRAERIMVPLLDILQSIPVLGFLPGLVLALVAVFPRSNIGLELAAVLMIFTGQAWNMTFSFYNSLRSIPAELREAGRVYKLNWRQRFTKLELPYAAIGLIWNSMMSMAGGWFFLTVNEAFVLGNKDFRLPGIGSYMSVAIAQGNVPAMIYAVIAMTAMIVLVDQFFWRPLVAWAQKYKVEETESAETATSFVLNLLQRSQLLKLARQVARDIKSSLVPLRFSGGTVVVEQEKPLLAEPLSKYLKSSVVWLFNGVLLTLVAYGSWKLLLLLSAVTLNEWGDIGIRLLLTFIRVIIAVTMGTIIMVPIGVALGLNPKLSRILQPVVQVAASFPAPMLFPLVIIALSKIGFGIEIGSIALMGLGTQWYILFNVIAGAMAIPQDLMEAAHVARLTRWQTWKRLILPAIFPTLVTGWVTATGGAWNASIVAEHVHFGERQLTATGLGSAITTATDEGNFAVLAASVLAMVISVVFINRLLWRKLYQHAEEQYSLNK